MLKISNDVKGFSSAVLHCIVGVGVVGAFVLIRKFYFQVVLITAATTTVSTTTKCRSRKCKLDEIKDPTHFQINLYFEAV